MLACLPGPSDLSLQLLPHTQMNAGPQKWDTTQRMRAAQFPTPAELDAYAKKVADSPLTIKIFPNSVKVPQRNHVRRTVNGLDTSGHQRYSPYPPSPASAKAGLLAVVRAPMVKGGVLKDFHGGRARPESAAMNPPAGPYQVASSSTLEPHRPPPPPQQMGHAQPLHMLPQQQGPMAQGLRHTVPSMTQHPHGLPRPQTLPQAPPGPHGPPGPMLHLQPPPHAPQQLRQQLPDGEAPPNVTVSTSTIPLSMAGGGCGGQRPGDLSAIVHQISQFCQARAQGAVAASVCEGQIANPSPISRSLLISACSRGSCVQLLPPENSLAAMNHLPAYHGDVKQQQQHLQQQHMHAQQALQQQQQQQMLSWNHSHSQPPLAHLHHVQNGCHPCGQPSRDAGFSCKGLAYGPEVCVGQPYILKPPVERPTPSPPVNVPMAHYPNNNNAHYYHSHLWGGGGGGGGGGSILPTPNSDSSGSQDLAMPFHGGAPGGTATALDCGPPGASHYRLGTGSCSSSTTSSSTSSSSTAAQTNLMQMADYLGGDFQTPYLRDQNLGLMGKMHRPPMSRVGLEAGDVRLVQHPGYR